MSKPTGKLKTLARNLRKRDTWAEKLMWTWLRDRRFSDYKFRRQHMFGPHILDFFCVEALLNIELDGSQHGFPEQQEKDAQRDRWLDKAGVKVLRFWNSNLRRERDSIQETIWRELQMRAPHPLPDYCRPGVAGRTESTGDNSSAKQNSRSRDITVPSPQGRGLG